MLGLFRLSTLATASIGQFRILYEPNNFLERPTDINGEHKKFQINLPGFTVEGNRWCATYFNSDSIPIGVSGNIEAIRISTGNKIRTTDWYFGIIFLN